MPARKTVFALGALFVASLFTGCGTDTAPGPPETVEARQVEFVSHRVVDNAEYWWALAVGDVDADGLQDVVYINNNANGGYLGYRSGSKSGNLWAETIVAEAPPAGGTFAAGDLEVADMNGDGTLDILAVKHTGEWDDAGAAAEIFYYAAPDWRPVAIGPAKDAVKDLSVEDFNADGLPDLLSLDMRPGNEEILKATMSSDAWNATPCSGTVVVAISPKSQKWLVLRLRTGAGAASSKTSTATASQMFSSPTELNAAPIHLTI